MASVHRDPRNKSPFWFAAFTTPDGQRHFKSTKIERMERKRGDALALARHWETLGRDIHEQDPIGAQISKVNREIYKQVTGRALEVVRLGKFLRDWVETASRLKPPRTASRYKSVIDDFLAHMGESREVSSMTSVTVQEVQEFINKEYESGKSAGTVEMSYKVLRIPFNQALRQGIVTINPVTGVERPQDRAEEKKPFTWDEVKKLIDAATGEWKTVVLLGAYCGMRLGDCVNLKWSNVDFKNKKITYLPSKNSKKRNAKEISVPFSEQLEEHLTALASNKRKPEDFLSPTLQKRSISGRSGLSGEFIKTIMKEAGIEKEVTGRIVAGVGRNVSKQSFHSLRHTFVSELANRGVSQEIRRAFAGHVSDKMSDRYTHLDDQIRRKAIKKLK